jgi:SAM-dependent methyltransferase
LARDGHTVVTVDAGLDARGIGWMVNTANHQVLSRALGAPAQLIPTTLAAANLDASSVDVLLSVSTLEHFAPPDLEEFSAHAARILRPDGIAVMTIDLFLDLSPFSQVDHNKYGTNVDVRRLLLGARLALREGRPAELLGFPEFNAANVLAHLNDYMIGTGYPALAQCLVAEPSRAG